MVSYTQNELLSITDFTKQISKILTDVKERSLEKVGILKNNRLEAVVISTQEYEKLKKLEKFLERYFCIVLNIFQNLVLAVLKLLKYRL